VRRRQTIGRRRLAALIACCLSATMLPFSAATAEEGIPAGSGAVVTAGAPLAVRSAPGWDAAVAYEIANGTYVTVWDGAQVAPDGSLWYPVDGGFVPVEAVTSTATLKGGAPLYQDTTQEASAVDVADPTTAAAPVADPPPADPAGELLLTEDAVELAATDAATETATNEALVDTTGSSDPTQDEGIDPATVDPTASAPEGDPLTSDGSDSTQASSEAKTDGVDPATAQAVVPAPGDAPAGDLAAPIDSPPVETRLTSGSEPPGQPIALAYLEDTSGAGAACLAAPDWSSETLAILDEGVPVEVRAETMGEWQPVNCAGSGGYVHTSLVAWEASTSSVDFVELEQKKRKGKGTSGQDIVDFALRYEGARYVDAGEGQQAFDCSGFTMFVIKKTLGLDITHDMAVQYEMGSHVRRNALKPGDLVFFKNTYRRGLSHTGIYIGGGQFIHAENESTGVRISDLESDYYSSRWYGAARFT
jgi:cell wall-associated NlpC family hydrolase